MRIFDQIFVVVVVFVAFVMAQGAASADVSRVTIHETVAFDGLKGWTHDGVTYRLACGADIAQMPNGDLLCG